MGMESGGLLVGGGSGRMARGQAQGTPHGVGKARGGGSEARGSRGPAPSLVLRKVEGGCDSKGVRFRHGFAPTSPRASDVRMREAVFPRDAASSHAPTNLCRKDPIQRRSLCSRSHPHSRIPGATGCIT